MSNTVYKYYLNGHQYTPKNTGEITLNYERVQENGSYQYIKNIGNSVVYDNKNGAYDYINSFGECQKISISIYSVSLELIKDIINYEEKSPGKYEFFWDGKDSSGKNADAGIYFVIIYTKNEKQITKFLLKSDL